MSMLLAIVTITWPAPLAGLNAPHTTALQTRHYKRMLALSEGEMKFKSHGFPTYARVGRFRKLEVDGNQVKISTEGSYTGRFRGNLIYELALYHQGVELGRTRVVQRLPINRRDWKREFWMTVKEVKEPMEVQVFFKDIRVRKHPLRTKGSQESQDEAEEPQKEDQEEPR